MNKLLKVLLRTGVYFLDQAEDAAAPIRSRVRDRVDDFTGRAAHLVHRHHNHTARYAMSFAAGVGLGLGAGLLFAPASGEQTREVMGNKIQSFGENVRDRFSGEGKASRTGTEG